MNTWVAYSPFGAFPLWTDASFARIQQQIACEAPFNTMYAGYNDGTNQWADVLGYYDQNNAYGGDVCRAPFDFFNSGMLSKNGQLPLLTGGPPCGSGTQTATYALDSATGFYVPVSVQGSNNCPDISMLESFGIFVALATAVIGGAELLAPAATAAPGAAVTGTTTAAETGAAVTTVDVAGSAVAPEIASFTVPEIAAAAPLDLAAMPAVDIASVASTAATAAVSPLSQVFSVLNYIKQLAGAYSTVKSLTQLTGGAATHPQAGVITHLPDGSTSVVNPDGSITVTQPTGTMTTIGAGGTITPGPAAAPPVLQAGFGGIGTLVMGLSVLGYLLSR